MRLINIHTLETRDFPAARPEYAILSHRWERDEMSFQDYQDSLKRHGQGYTKVENFCRLVRTAEWAHGQSKYERIGWAWIDTCCIDKSSSSELSEAINSMWTWYLEAAVCIAYISDCEWSNSRAKVLRSLRASHWFLRGWTLQELLAPKDVLFYAQDWHLVGRRNTTDDLRQAITLATTIEAGYLQGRKYVAEASIAQRMSWASARKTTRGEDLAYCLMGIFNVNMPLLYGEGREKAFYRLQEEIVKQSNDESIFAFGLNMYGLQPGLAGNPQQFVDCEHVRSARRVRRSPYTITNAGLEFESPSTKWTAGQDEFYIINLNYGRLVHLDIAEALPDSSDAVRLRGCVMVLRRIGDRYVRDFSWEKTVEKTSTSAAQAFLDEGTWQEIKPMRFHLAVTVNDVYTAMVDERQNLLSIKSTQKLWYEDNHGPLFRGYDLNEGGDQDTNDMPAIEDGEFEISDDEGEKLYELQGISRPAVQSDDHVAALSLGPFELEA